MLDHLSLTVRDLGRSKTFYAQALAPLGGGVQMEFEGSCGIGQPGKPSFWLMQGDSPTSATHVAFVATERPAVDAFYAAALAAGGRDNGPPGLRADYHPSYYAAFVIDPDGHNVEAVCHTAPGAARRTTGARRRRPAAKRVSGKGSTRSARKPSRKTARKAARKTSSR